MCTLLARQLIDVVMIKSACYDVHIVTCEVVNLPLLDVADLYHSLLLRPDDVLCQRV